MALENIWMVVPLITGQPTVSAKWVGCVLNWRNYQVGMKLQVKLCCNYLCSDILALGNMTPKISLYKWL